MESSSKISRSYRSSVAGLLSTVLAPLHQQGPSGIMVRNDQPILLEVVEVVGPQD
jgi:hypothetical protein